MASYAKYKSHIFTETSLMRDNNFYPLSSIIELSVICYHIVSVYVVKIKPETNNK